MLGQFREKKKIKVMDSSPTLAILFFWLFRDKTLKQTLDLTCELGTIEQNSLTPNFRLCVALDSYEQVFPETQQHNLIIVCRKLLMQMKQAQCDQAKWNKVINQGLTIQAITIE